MARRVRDAVLDTRAARKRLKPRAEPHWRALALGLHLGYRRRPRDGSWVARRRNDAGQYIESKLGLADDWLDANGATVLDYAQAQAAAKSWADEEARREHGLGPKNAGPYTVADAMKDYLATGKDDASTVAYVNAHILPKLGDVELKRITQPQIRGWLHSIAAAPPRRRSKKLAGAPKFGPQAADADAKRRRRATANRVLTILKAALNLAWKDGHVADDKAWRSVKPFAKVDVPVIRYLGETECARLVNATDKAFRPVVVAGLLTGCRYGELTALRARDFNTDAGTLTIRASKSGHPRHVALTDEGRSLFAGITAGKADGDLLFTRNDGKAWGKSQQQRPLARACKAAKISPAIGFHVLRHTYASTLARRGVSMRVIADQLGHKDTRITERHYAHLAPSYVADVVRANFPTLGIVPASNITRLKPKAQTSARHRRG